MKNKKYDCKMLRNIELIDLINQELKNIEQKIQKNCFKKILKNYDVDDFLKSILDDI